MSEADRAAPNVLVIGNCNVDLVMGPIGAWPQIGTEITTERSELRAGGSAGNSALALQAFGAPHLLVSSRGDDALGGWLAGEFYAATSRWAVSPRATTVSVGIVHASGERTFFTTPGHLLDFNLDEIRPLIPTSPAKGSVALLSGVFLSPAIFPAYAGFIGALKALGYAVAIDTGWPDEGWTEAMRTLTRDWLARCDHALFNEAEVAGLAATDDFDVACASVAGMLPPGACLIVKRGGSGASGFRSGERIDVPAPPVTVIDTIGAGDTFNAGYLAARIEGQDIAACIRRGVEAASLAVSTEPRRYS
ncbi:Sugar or nucleoside kinase, ribokinase family [Faunimonas pinastri]|uniref:Sugar or nucleoside kinase, ribokinase family n=1 Tax=Faunimonas pinastri TaxID=1855383 RepID=A0A1H9PB87_9HYPH|nr:carbohydrate kinase family protein [Faunimonas pinastri]SER45448.1 Sugar or nucleoside kinase, ribokinase family [Faunimonas pinastri]